MIPKGELHEGWYWVEELMLPFKPQLQIVRVGELLYGDGGPMHEETTIKLVVYQTGVGRFKELSKFNFIIKIEELRIA